MWKTVVVWLFLGGTALCAQQHPPIIDMHVHAGPIDGQGPPPIAICAPIEEFPHWDPAEPYAKTFGALTTDPPCENPIWSPDTDEELFIQTVEVMERHNVVGVLSGTPELVTQWRNGAPDRFIPGLGFRLGRDGISVDSLRRLHESGEVAVLAEVTNQYAGIAPDDPRMEPYWALAESLDLPVGIHVGTGPPGVIYLGMSGYRGRLHSALTMEEVLVKHPRLRVYLMHAGFPLIDDLLTVLYAHPQVYVDVGLIVYTQPRVEFYRYLRRIVEAGYGKRVMFGSDQMVWPEAIEHSIAVIEEAPFLTPGMKRDILYNNAARFLRLSDEEIAEHHGR